MSLLATTQLSTSIGSTEVCRGLELRIEAAERWCILGRNGTGKTTLLHTLAGLLPPAGGSIAVNGKPLQTLPRRLVAQQIGILFQDHLDAFPANVLETVLAGRHPWLGPLQWETASDLALARKALQAVDLEDVEQRIVTTLSGLSLIHISEPTRLVHSSRMPSSA